MPAIHRQNLPPSSWPHPTSYLERDPHPTSPHLVNQRLYYHHTMSTSTVNNPALMHPTRVSEHPTSWSAYPEEVIPLPAPLPPPPPPPPPQKVWILDCRSCNLFLTNRGMKASGPLKRSSRHFPILLHDGIVGPDRVCSDLVPKPDYRAVFSWVPLDLQSFEIGSLHVSPASASQGRYELTSNELIRRCPHGCRAHIFDLFISSLR
jgi:hypothetical protein